MYGRYIVDLEMRDRSPFLSQRPFIVTETGGLGKDLVDWRSDQGRSKGSFRQTVEDCARFYGSLLPYLSDEIKYIYPSDAVSSHYLYRTLTPPLPLSRPIIRQHPRYDYITATEGSLHQILFTFGQYSGSNCESLALFHFIPSHRTLTPPSSHQLIPQ